jgi:hypothetical protein
MTRRKKKETHRVLELEQRRRGRRIQRSSARTTHGHGRRLSLGFSLNLTNNIMSSNKHEQPMKKKSSREDKYNTKIHFSKEQGRARKRTNKKDTYRVLELGQLGMGRGRRRDSMLSLNLSLGLSLNLSLGLSLNLSLSLSTSLNRTNNPTTQNDKSERQA